LAGHKKRGTRPQKSAAADRPRRHFVIQPQFLEDLRYWVREDPILAERLLRLVEEARRDPFRGLGKPEPMQGEYAGCWSRRLTGEHRFVYRVLVDAIDCLQGRYHY
jgi:toxin YoeB